MRMNSAGPIPPALGQLGNLFKLSLENNELSGSIPSALGNLANLLELRLNDNPLSGSIPSALGNLAQTPATLMALRQCNSAAPSRAALGNLAQPADTVNRLFENELSGSHPARSWGNLVQPGIAYNSTDNQLSGPIPKDVGGLDRAHPGVVSPYQ